MLKKKEHILPTFQNITKSMKLIYPFNDPKQRSMSLHCSKKPIGIIKKNNVKT